jgi:hypothetical protein
MKTIPLFPKCVICGNDSNPDYTLITGDPCCHICNLEVQKAQLQKEIDALKQGNVASNKRRKIGDSKMSGYVGFHKGRRYEVEAISSYQAQKKIAEMGKIKRPHEIAVILAEDDGKQVIHKPLF